MIMKPSTEEASKLWAKTKVAEYQTLCAFSNSPTSCASDNRSRQTDTNKMGLLALHARVINHVSAITTFWRKASFPKDARIKINRTCRRRGCRQDVGNQLYEFWTTILTHASFKEYRKLVYSQRRPGKQTFRDSTP